MSKDISILIHRQEHTFEEVQVTPQIAGQLLKNNYDHNRPTRPSVISRYAKMMTDGEWNPLAADPIKVSKTGKLLNGQHRMNAIIVSGEAILCTIETGLDEKDYKDIDQGKARNAADIVGSVPQRTALAAGIKCIINWEEGIRTQAIFSTSVTNRQVGEWVEANGIDGIDLTAYNLWRNAVKTPPSVSILFVWIAQQLDPTAFEEFSNLLVKGAGMAEDHPVFRAREWLLTRGRVFRPSEKDKFIMFMTLVKAWNIWRAGGKCKKLVSDKEWKGMS